MGILIIIIAVIFGLISGSLLYTVCANWRDMWKYGNFNERLAWSIGVFLTSACFTVSFVSWYLIYSGDIHANSF